MSIYQKLLTVQTELKAPKNQYNSYGQYSYRSCEDILEALKPLLKKVNASIQIQDTIREIAGRVYVEAAVSFFDVDDMDHPPIYVTAFAREPENKKGMDESQITGTASSYARKYALNGLFLIDDAKDPDTDEHRKEADKKAEKTTRRKKTAEENDKLMNKFVSTGQLETLNMLIKKANITEEKFCEVYGIAVMPEFPSAKYEEAVSKLEAAIKVKKGDK